MSETITIEKADVVAIAPELSGVADAVFDTFIAEASEEVDVEAWGSLARANIGGTWLVAHKVRLWQQRSALGAAGGISVGPITSVRVGDVSKVFATAGGITGTKEDIYFASTAYGVEYLRLRRQWVIALGMVV